MPLWVLSGKHVFFSIFGAIGKKQHLTEHPADKYQGGKTRATSCTIACSPPTASLFFLAAQASKLSLSAYLEWAEETDDRHPRDNDDDAAIKVLEFFLCVLDRSRASRRALPIELVGKNCLRPPGFLLRSHRRSTLCYDLYLWARLLPRLPPVEGHDLWPRLGSSVVPKHRCVASGVGTCLSSCITTLLEVNSIRSNQKTVSWASFFIWIGPTCRLFPSTQFTNVSLVIYTLPFI